MDPSASPSIDSVTDDGYNQADQGKKFLWQII